MARISLVALLALTAAAVAVVATAPLRSAHLPHGWQMKDRVAADRVIPMVFAIKLQNVDLLEDYLLRSSNPKSEIFLHHLTLKQVHDLTSNWEATTKVYQWLMANDVDADNVVISRGGNFIHVKLPAVQAERLIDGAFHEYHHEEANMTAVRTPFYQLPKEISERVDFVSVTHMFPSAKPRMTMHKVHRNRSTSGTRANGIPPGYTTPQILYSYYNIQNPSVSSTQSTQSVYENLGQSYSPVDLTDFQKEFGLPQVGIATVFGPNTPTACKKNQNNCVEADLDVEYIMAIAQSAPTTYWSIGDSSQQPFLDWIVAVDDDANAPYVHSISYGDIEQQDDHTMQQRFSAEVMKLGARGITVMVASGDDGVANFIARSDPTQCGFNPSFPASCPYVTAVGATQGPENKTDEIACTSATGGGITTGGGFSTVFDRPSYQDDAVNSYLSNGDANLPPTSQFNSKGRGYPDVAMMGHNYIVFDGAQATAGSGTSASSPVFAGLITLVNADRISNGKQPIGFLNQILYQLASTNPEVFHDITSGKNNCCAGDPGQQTCCKYGFTSTSGWDPLTGLGSVDYQNLHDALVSV